jgi:hypothetical protein
MIRGSDDKTVQQWDLGGRGLKKHKIFARKYRQLGYQGMGNGLSLLAGMTMVGAKSL